MGDLWQSVPQNSRVHLHSIDDCSNNTDAQQAHRKTPLTKKRRKKSLGASPICIAHFSGYHQTPPPPPENPSDKFAGLREKNFSVNCNAQSVKRGRSHLPPNSLLCTSGLEALTSFGKDIFLTGAGWCMVSLSQHNHPTGHGTLLGAMLRGAA